MRLGWLDLLLGLWGGLLLGLRLGLPHHRTTQRLLTGWGVVDGGGSIRIHEGLACKWDHTLVKGNFSSPLWTQRTPLRDAQNGT